jgi:hypothetical protein
VSDPADAASADTEAAGPGDAATPAPPLRLTGGGIPRPEELAALTAALTALSATAGATAVSSAPPVPAWRRAARTEQAGRPRVTRPSDLRGR